MGEALPKKQKTASTVVSSISSSLASMSSSLLTPVTIYSRGSITSDALETHKEILKQAVKKLAGYEVVLEVFEVHSAYKGKDTRKDKSKVDVFDDMKLIQFLKNPNGIHDMFIIAEDRLARNPVLAGTILSLCKQHRITIHIVGIESPYKFVPLTGEGEQRLWIAMLNSIKESQEKSERAIRSAQHRSLLSSLLPYEPPFVSQKMMELLTLMINGCSVEVYYKVFNEMLEKNHDQKERYGGDWFFSADDGSELRIIRKNSISLSRMLTTFNTWELFRENIHGMLKKPWSKASLTEVISHHFGKDVLEQINKKWDEEDVEDIDVLVKDEDMGDALPAVLCSLTPSQIIALNGHTLNVNNIPTCNSCGHNVASHAR